MARVIDANKLPYYPVAGGNLVVYKDDIENAPTVDAVEVVRCKDCKWFADNNNGEWYGCWLYNTILSNERDKPGRDDFCSYGERKDNA